MPSYVEEDDSVDYENETPHFQDESEFDDYLNDDEYDLMNEMFPRAKKALDEYQGWNNLSVKMAIFDNDFDLETTLEELKKALKKKKTMPPAPMTSQIPKDSKMRLGFQQGTMSKLEQLARAKAAERPLNITNAAINNYDGGLEQSRSISLLSRLKKNEGLGTIESPQKLSLADKLKAKGKTRSSSVIGPGTANATTEENGSRSSLHLKLRALGKQTVPMKPLLQERGKSFKMHEVKNSASKSVFPKSADHIRHLRSIQNEQSATPVSLDDSTLGTIKAVITPCKRNIQCEKLQKRRYDEIFTVFYPNELVNTNKRKAIKKTAVSNFQKPSPDDVARSAQANAFNQVHEKVSNLKISNEKSSNGEGYYDSEMEDINKEEETPKRAYKKVTTPTKPTNPIDVQKYLENAKPHCSFVVLGHVDAGKSTLMGRLLYDIGAVDNNHIRKLKRESERIGKGSFHLAWVMDQTQEERERGVTVSICTSDFETEKTQFTIVDAPGHRDFVPNAIAGISQADVAVLCVDCGTDAFESGFNLDGQTKEHTLLARSMGVSQIIVAMNKMDTVEWYSDRFAQIKNELSTFFQDIGFKDDQISWVPCSGLSGEGVCKVPYPASASWYEGPSLIEKLEFVAKIVSTAYRGDVLDSPFLFSILEVIPTNKNEEAIISGRVESGSIQPGETITVYPSEQSVVVTKILTGNEKKSASVVTKGDFAILRLRHAHVEDIEAGDLAGSVDYDLPGTGEFSAQLLTFRMERPILPGTPFLLFRGVCQQPARISKLISIVEKQDSSKIIKKKVRHLGSNQAAIVEIELTERKRWLPILKFNQNKRLGRILLRKDGRTIAAGAVI